MEFRGLSGEPREPTMAERDRQRRLQEQGVADVYLDVEQTPREWWAVVLLLTHEFVISKDHTPGWEAWLREWRFRTGWSEPQYPGARTYADLVGDGVVSMRGGQAHGSDVYTRLAAIETLLDIQAPIEREFTEHLNERARWFHVGLRLEGHRFVPIKGEHLHEEIVQPTLLLLADGRLAPVDDLYRKAFARYLQGDASGAITAAVSAVEEMLRLGLGSHGDRSDLAKLCARAQTAGWMTPAIAETAKKLHALRSDSDAHAVGTEKLEISLFALHITGSVLLYLGDTFAAAPGGRDRGVPRL